jgi:hypothetical protein
MTRKQDDLATAYFRKHGLHAGSQAILRDFAVELMQPARRLIESGAWARVRVEEMFTLLRTQNSHWHLEIVRPEEGEFLIGDVPVGTSHKGATRPGILGVPLGEATQLVMPLTAQVAVSVGAEPAYATLPQRDVHALNSWQVSAAVEYVFHRPSADFGDFVNKIRQLDGAG